jgi:glycosyltransferase involved in cell wall biosynthesis
MRVCFDHQVFSLQNVGGASRYFIELAKFIGTSNSAELFLLLGLTNSALPLCDLSEKHVRIFQAPSHIRPGLVRYALNELISNIVAPLKGRFHIYHSTYYRAVPFIRSHRVIATHHDCVQENFPGMFPDVKRIRNAKRALYHRADAIICVSEASKDDLCKFYEIDNNRVHVVYHGLSRLNHGANANQHIRDLPRRPYLLYVGSRVAYKNFKGLLVAYQRSGLHNEFDLVTVGGGASSQEECKLMHTLGIGDKVRFYTPATDQFLASAYAGAHLFVYPSLYEGFGFPPLEAMSLGCPSLVANSSSLPEICGNGAFYFDSDSEESFVASLKIACFDDSKRRAIVALGKVISSKYSWEDCGRKTLHVYQEALNV